MRNLLLTLGHNSSAILIEDGEIAWGYETERITGLKSDSQFPAPILDHKKLKNVDMVYVSHWGPDGSLRNLSRKHWQPERFDGVPVRSVNHVFTHHDAHMAAAMCYAGPQFVSKKHRNIGVVVDGFGTLGEHFSVYELSERGSKLLERVHGYETSLGLWYQYATAFMGMKMHEDEYKLLGYEAGIDMCLSPHQIEALSEEAAVTANNWMARMRSSIYGSQFDPMYNVDALPAIKNRVFHHLTEIATKYGVADVSSSLGRTVLAFYVQMVLERVVITTIGKYKPERLLLSGGVFYNVKLNKRILDNYVGSLVCVYPLAGDQGCALGLYAQDHPEFKFPESLCWGVRTLKSPGTVPGLTCVASESDAYEVIDQALCKVGYINLVRGAMEFGPRALCNTSTLAIPTRANVERINRANDRNTVMPMAPVMTMTQFKGMFDNWQSVWKSYKHMVVALEYSEFPLPGYMGIAHEYFVPYHHHTGRPQVVDPGDRLMNRLLNEHGPLINTSFNFHGKPIAYEMSSVVESHMRQRALEPIPTVVVTNA